MPVGLALSAGIASLASPATIIASGALVSTVLFLLALTRPWLRAVE